jgi:NAD(P)-dependent dehydrogenase (short-subunit alcohol dehydrogenase family)
MAKTGWKVALVSRTQEELETVRHRIDGQGGQSTCHAADVSDLGSIRQMWNEVCGRWGDPDCLVNNAAVVEPVGPAVEVDPSSWARSVEINLIGAFFCARTALATMVARRRGSLLNIVSGMGEKIFPSFSAYSVSKAGLIHLTRLLAEEVRPYGVTVNALDPGLVQTDMQAALRDLPAEAVGEEMRSRFRFLHAKGMLKPPELVGSWISAFLSDKAREITGEVGSLSDYEARHGIPVLRR